MKRASDVAFTIDGETAQTKPECRSWANRARLQYKHGTIYLAALTSNENTLIKRLQNLLQRILIIIFSNLIIKTNFFTHTPCR